jgi:type IV pilus assembly protein PilA
MRALNMAKKEKGFTLIELMIVVAIIGILSAIAVPNFLSYRTKGYDMTAKVDLTHAMKFLSFYHIENGTFPASDAGLLASGFRLSEDVSFASYSIGTYGSGEQTVHMHIQHASSPNAWHANYPKEGSAIAIR